ncbi:MAG: protein phosphatase 2C domain-containing protein, partial [Deltaproteobacteria bacterium]|nr:protein phosphatase 2C domain-containing protein [Deltaproteobacteria bacterium]
GNPLPTPNITPSTDMLIGDIADLNVTNSSSKIIQAPPSEVSGPAAMTTTQGIGYPSTNADAVAYVVKSDGKIGLVNADGAGGSGDPVFAAHQILGSFTQEFARTGSLEGSLHHAHQVIWKHNVRLTPEARGYACANTVMIEPPSIEGQPSKAHFVWAGDTRSMVLRRNGAGKWEWIYRTRDHNGAGEKAIADVKTNDDAKRKGITQLQNLDPHGNLILNAIGNSANFRISKTAEGLVPHPTEQVQPAAIYTDGVPLKTGDLILQGSDGLWENFLHTQYILDLIQNCKTPEQVVKVLTEATHARMQVLKDFSEGKLAKVGNRHAFELDGQKLFLETQLDAHGQIDKFVVYKSANPNDHEIFDSYKPDNFSVQAYFHEPKAVAKSSSLPPPAANALPAPFAQLVGKIIQFGPVQIEILGPVNKTTYVDGKALGMKKVANETYAQVKDLKLVNPSDSNSPLQVTLEISRFGDQQIQEEHTFCLSKDQAQQMGLELNKGFTVKNYKSPGVSNTSPKRYTPDQIHQMVQSGAHAEKGPDGSIIITLNPKKPGEAPVAITIIREDLVAYDAKYKPAQKPQLTMSLDELHKKFEAGQLIYEDQGRYFRDDNGFGMPSTKAEYEAFIEWEKAHGVEGETVALHLLKEVDQVVKPERFDGIRTNLPNKARRHNVNHIFEGFGEAAGFTQPGIDKAVLNGQRPPALASNEDAFGFARDSHGNPILVVADGMGGLDSGDVASALAVRNILDLTESGKVSNLGQAFLQAHQEIRSETKGLPGRPSTVATAVRVEKDGQVWITSAGDTRLFVLRKNAKGLFEVIAPYLPDSRAAMFRKNLVAARNMGVDLEDTLRFNAHETNSHVQSGLGQAYDKLNLVPELSHSNNLGEVLDAPVTLPSDPNNPNSSRVPFKMQKGDMLLLTSDGVAGLFNRAQMARLMNEAQAKKRVLNSGYELSAKDASTELLHESIVRLSLFKDYHQEAGKGRAEIIFEGKTHYMDAEGFIWKNAEPLQNEKPAGHVSPDNITAFVFKYNPEAKKGDYATNTPPPAHISPLDPTPAEGANLADLDTDSSAVPTQKKPAKLPAFEEIEEEVPTGKFKAVADQRPEVAPETRKQPTPPPPAAEEAPPPSGRPTVVSDTGDLSTTGKFSYVDSKEGKELIAASGDGSFEEQTTVYRANGKGGLVEANAGDTAGFSRDALTQVTQERFLKLQRSLAKDESLEDSERYVIVRLGIDDAGHAKPVGRSYAQKMEACSPGQMILKINRDVAGNKTFELVDSDFTHISAMDQKVITEAFPPAREELEATRAMPVHKAPPTSPEVVIVGKGVQKLPQAIAELLHQQHFSKPKSEKIGTLFIAMNSQSQEIALSWRPQGQTNPNFAEGFKTIASLSVTGDLRADPKSYHLHISEILKTEKNRAAVTSVVNKALSTLLTKPE